MQTPEQSLYQTPSSLPFVGDEQVALQLSKVKWIVTDVDGVLTDGSIQLDHEGRESKRFNVRDGVGFYLAKQAGIQTAFLTGRLRPVVEHRARELSVDRVIGAHVDGKAAAYAAFLEAEKTHSEHVLYIGDDIIDVPILKRAGCSICPADADELAKQFAHAQTRAKGGSGVFREVVEAVLKAQDKWNFVIDSSFGIQLQ